ncbi:MAG: right-handed parallel beta-helix repeat-containing protein [Actinomycetota bacterium]|nr:right-handed parallel beta-helix repeat-containing protein [Actinomycetota bacterium]
MNPGQSIQAAINGAPAGSTITVKPGTYHENVWITKNNVKLQGTPGKTILRPAEGDPTGPCAFPGGDNGDGPPENSGICVIGNFDFSTFTLIAPVKGVSVTGFTEKNFPNQGVFVVGGLNTTVSNNIFTNNGGYGVFANTSTNTAIVANSASGSSEAGIYVGDSPTANAVIKNNTVFDNGFGIFIRSASHGAITSNNAHDNCVGILFLNAPNAPENWTVSSNQVNHNNKACPANGEESPPASGGGIVLVGANNNTFTSNTMNGNAPSGPTFLSGGMVLVLGSTGNTVVNNTAHNNLPVDLFDVSGGANTFVANHCDASIPPGLCA